MVRRSRAARRLPYVASVVADDAGLRRDLQICRELGVPLRRFLGDTSGPDFDEWERAVWRAFHDWENDKCPGCGNPLTESLWDPKTPPDERPKWRAVYHQCRACLELENAQIKQEQLDDKARQQAGKDAPRQPYRYRKWSVSRDD